MMMILGKQVYFSIEHINELYRLQNVGIEQFNVKSCEPRTWMENILSNGKDDPWATTKRDIMMNDFIDEAGLWLNIIYR